MDFRFFLPIFQILLPKSLMEKTWVLNKRTKNAAMPAPLSIHLPYISVNTSLVYPVNSVVYNFHPTEIPLIYAHCTYPIIFSEGTSCCHLNSAPSATKIEVAWFCWVGKFYFFFPGFFPPPLLFWFYYCLTSLFPFFFIISLSFFLNLPFSFFLSFFPIFSLS